MDMRCPYVVVREQKNRREWGKGSCKGERMVTGGEKEIAFVGDMLSISWLDNF